MGDNTPLKLCFDAFELDEKNARLSQNGQPISLPPKAFAVLCALARQSGQLVTKSELLDVVWGHQHVSESVLKTIISELRVVLSDSAKQPRFVETASRRGYRFIAAIRPWSARDVPFAESALPDLRVRPVTERVETSPMIGRQATLDQLHAAWNNTIAGRRQIFWVAGEAGVGKTTLIDNFVAELGPNTYAYGQCVEQYGAGEPYLPVLEAVGVLCRNDPSLIPLLRAIAPTWLLQLPWLISETEREVLRRELAGMGHERMLRELGELLERYTLQQPLLLVTEDLHWSDHATIHLIDHIARRRGSMRLMWLASFRLAEVIAEDHPLKSLRHELRLHLLCDEIVLDPFSEQDLADYIGNRFPGSEVSEPFVRALHVRTDGLPLFVVNVIDDLATLDIFQSSATEPAGEIILPTQVPENLAGVIEKQIARLSPEQQELLEAASVCGMEFWPSTLGDALARDASWAAQHCNELARRQNWLSEVAVDQQPNGKFNMRYAFRHALYRQVFYQRIGSLARSQLHRRIAVSLESSRAAGSAVTAAELASHFELSHDLAAALRYLTEAIDHALRHFAPREALVLSTHALSLLSRSPVDSQRDALELALTAMRGVAAAQLFGVSSLDAKGAFERAKALLEVLPEHPLRSLVLHALGLVLLVRGEYAEARALSERIYELSEKYADPILLLSACSVLGQIHTLQGRQQDGREWLERGVAACEALGDETLQAAFVVDPGVTMYAALALPLLHVGLVDQARARLETALARARRLGQPMAHMVALWFSSLFEVRLGNTDRVATLADTMRAIVEDAALAQGYGPSRWYRGWAEARLGASLEGYRSIRHAFEHNARLGMYCGGPEVLGYATEALVLAGDWDAAQQQFDEAMKLAERLAERAYLPQLLMLRARIALAKEDLGAAREATYAALHEAHDQKAPWLELAALVALCELDPPMPEDFDALQEACARLSEGSDTSLVIKARELLGGSTGCTR